MGGDHKCPLCSATFTRPQHVGRHLRAHTGDRPYECKQCPLKFARSDLLSRHVNKAHPKPADDRGADERMNSQAAAEKKAAGKSKMKVDGQPGQPGPSSARSSLDLRSSLTSVPYTHVNPYAYQQYPNTNGMAGPSSAYPIQGVQMQLSQSESGVHPALVRPPMDFQTMDQHQQHMLALQQQQHQMPFRQEKARACDQCNHSKVKCDSGRPCAKCIHRSVPCTYDKPSKHRTQHVQPPSQPQAVAHEQLDRRRNSFAASEQPNPFHSHSQMQHQPQPMAYYPSPPGMYNPSPPYVNYNPTFTPSPQIQHLAPTPALTQGTSPAGSDELLDPQRGGVPGFVPTLGMSQEGVQWANSPEDFQPNQAYPSQSQPSQQQLHQQLQQQFAPPPSLDPAYMTTMLPPIPQPGLYDPWAQQTFDPRFNQQQQQPQVFQSDDDDPSFAASSSSRSSYIDLADLGKAEGRPARRLSTGVWQNAFDQMSLQDRMAGELRPVAERGEYMGAGAGTIRPSFPTYTLPNGEVEQRMPSLSDTKDLWKMFMTDPAMLWQPGEEAQQQQQQQQTPTGLAIPMTPPRPGMGKRTLSKSNSLPDLNSPLANTALVSSFRNGTTPRPAEAQGAADPATVRKWSMELQARQGNFKMQLESVGRKSSSPSRLTQPASPTASKKVETTAGPAMDWQAMPPPLERPLASVRQGGSLQQTLAPERVPSFSLTPHTSSDFPSTGPFPHTPQRTGLTPTKMGSGASGVLPAFARPGNKRLPSQTLMPDTQKRASFLFDEEEDGQAEEYSAVHEKVARHEAVGASKAGYTPVYAPSMAPSPHNNYNAIPSSPAHSPVSNFSPQTTNLPHPQMVAAQTWATWPPLTPGQPQMAGLDDLRKNI